MASSAQPLLVHGRFVPLSFAPPLSYCFRLGVSVFIIAEDSAAELFQSEKDPGEQAPVFSFPCNLTWKAPSASGSSHFQDFQWCPGNNRGLSTVYIPGKACIYLLNSAVCNYLHDTKESAIERL